MKKQLETSSIQQGACKHCGQIMSFETMGMTKPDQLDDWATEKCDCSTAQYHAQRIKSLANAKEKIKQFFGRTGEAGEIATQILNIAVDAISEDKIADLTINLGDGCKGKVSQNSKGNIKVERTDTKKIKYEQ